MKPYYDHQHTFGPANPQLNNDGTQLFGSPPYYDHQHTFGPVANGINNKGQQLFGRSRSLGEIGTGKKVGIATLIVVGGVATFAVSGLASASFDGYFLGRAKKKGITYKTIAKRNSVLGGVIGAGAAGLWLSYKN